MGTDDSGAVPLLSVLVLNYNYGHFLAECLESIVAQTMSSFEVVVLDDRSNDGSTDVVARFLSDPRIRLVVHEKNVGFTGSLIEGTERLSKGRYLTVVSADDVVLRPDAFERQVEMLERNPNAGFCFTAFDFWRDEGPATHRSFDSDVVLGAREATHEIAMCRGVWPPHSGTVLRAESYRAVGGYRRDLTMPLDLAMWFDLSMAGGFAYIADSCHVWRLHGNQMTTSKKRRNLEEIATVIEQSCARGEQLGLGTGSLTRRAIGSHFGAFAASEAFADRRREALARCRAALMVRPLPSLTSRRLWVAALRAVAGPRVYGVVQRTIGRRTEQSSEG